MFTGIIEATGTIRRITGGRSLKMTIECPAILDDVKLGDSIAVDGTCLTVTHFTAETFDVDIITGTSDRTKFSAVQAGFTVNLERALMPTSRMGGHFVTGHIDKVAKVMRTFRQDNTTVCHISLAPDDQPYVIDKGSIAVDGTSLTVFKLAPNYFEVQLIPETQRQTKLMQLKPGDAVHLEFDMLGKYVLKQKERA